MSLEQLSPTLSENLQLTASLAAISRELDRRNTEAAEDLAEAAREQPLAEDWREWLYEGETGFDFRDPDYQTKFDERAMRLARIRGPPHLIPAPPGPYRRPPAGVIPDLGVT